MPLASVYAVCDPPFVQFAFRLVHLTVMLGWMFAIGHIALEHGAGAYSGIHHGLPCEDGHGHGHGGDDHGDAPGHHHHGFTVVAPGSLGKGPLLDLAPILDVPAEWVAFLSAGPTSWKPWSPPKKAPPDARESGWLLVSTTALRVRGPSLVS